MINSIEVYSKVGHDAALAVHQGDASRAAFELRFFQRMKATESPADRREAQLAYETAYRCTAARLRSRTVTITLL